MVSVSYQASTELRELIEDTVEFWCDASRQNGELIAGETAWKMIECIAQAKQAQMQGIVE